MRTIDHASFKEAHQRIPARFECIKGNQSHARANGSLSEWDRYPKWLKTYPNLFHGVPLGPIASYFCIKPESLSRRVRHSLTADGSNLKFAESADELKVLLGKMKQDQTVLLVMCNSNRAGMESLWQHA